MKSKENERRTVFGGNKEEFVSYVAERIFEDCQKKQSEFHGIDFGSLDCDVNEYSDLNPMHEDASSWNGIRALPNWFDSTSNRQYAADYYGGGSFGVCDIYMDDMDLEYVRREVTKMLGECLANSGSTIIWEIAK